MIRHLRNFIVATAAMGLLVPAAYAQNMTVKDGNGNPVTMCTTVNGSVNTPCSTIPAGADVTEGSPSDTPWNGTTGTKTVFGFLQGLFNAASGPTPAGGNHIGSINPVDSGLGDMTDAGNHALLVAPQTAGRIPPSTSSPLVQITSAITNIQFVAAGGANLYTYIDHIACSNHGQYSYTLTLYNSSGSAYWSFDVPAGGGWVEPFAKPIFGAGWMSVNTAINVQALGLPIGTMTVSASGNTYTSGTGATTLTLTAAPSFTSGEVVTLSGMTGTGASALNGVSAVATVSGSTISFTAPTGLGVTSITGGTVSYSAPNPNVTCNVSAYTKAS